MQTSTSMQTGMPRWRRWQPRSVLSLVLFGFAVAGLPFATGLIISSVQIETLSDESEALIAEAVTLTQATRGVLDRLASLERSARQLLILQDADARDTYRDARMAFREQLRVTSELDTGAAMRQRLNTLRDHESRLAEAVAADHGGAVWPPALMQGFRELDALGQALVTESETRAAAAVEHLHRLGQRAQSVVVWQFVIVLVLASVLAMAFTLLITRPLGALDRAIRSLGDPRGGRIRTVAGPRDLQALSVRLEAVRRKLRQNERDRQRLLGQVSHELKTPLSAIREGVSLLRDGLLGPVTGRQQEVIEILEGNAGRLQGQIETLLRYNRLQSGLKPAGRKRLDVAELVERILDHHGLTLNARGLEVERRVETGLAVSADPDMMHTVLDNLVSNAIKFSAPGARIGIAAAARGDEVVIEVADRGPGIDPADHERVFEPFYRGGDAPGATLPGTGLGLAICRDLVRAHGGDVVVVGRAGWTTVFRVRMPSGAGDEEGKTGENPVRSRT